MSYTGCCNNPDITHDGCNNCGMPIDAWDDEPTEDDYVTEDHQRFYQYGKLAVSVALDDDWRKRLREHMEANQYFPSVWFISDHGNAHIITDVWPQPEKE